MDETEKYFGCSSVNTVVIVVATSRVGARFGETGNPPSISLSHDYSVGNVITYSANLFPYLNMCNIYWFHISKKKNASNELRMISIVLLSI